MLSNKPSKPPNTEAINLNINESLILNQEVLRHLLTFLDFAPENELSIGFVEVNFARERDFLIKTLQAHPENQEIQFERFHFPEPDLRFLRDGLVVELENVTIDPNKKLVLLITGLENSIGMTGSYPPMLQDLNFVRDAFTTTVPYPLLFFLPDYALTRLGKYAPDFWAWRRSIFQFQTVEGTKLAALGKTLESGRILGSLDKPEKQERIDLLQRLLMEYCPSGKAGEPENLAVRVQIYNQLGRAYESRGEIARAQENFKQAITLANDQESAFSFKASALNNLACIHAQQGEVENAIALYKESLELKERIGDVQGKAATLHQLAEIYARQGEVESAIALYQESLELFERIGNVQGKAATLHQLAGIYAQQGEVESAIALYNESLELTERIGDVQGKAATLHQLAYIYAQQGEVEDAIALYQESLELKERIGDVQGKAITLGMLGQLLADRKGEIETGLEYLQESSAILQRLRSPNAATVQEIITRIEESHR